MTPIVLIAESSLSRLDWLVVGGYLLIMLASGVWFARREPSGAGEYFLANRRMPAWAVAFSVIASSLSVATFIGVPESVYKGNMTFMSTTIGSLIAVAVVAGFFIPAFYRANVTTVYGLLEQRFGPATKQAASAAFMVGRLFASGSRVYIAAIPLAMVLFGAEAEKSPAHLMAAIGLLSFVAVAYTLIGGIASVIWTDVLQTLVLVGAALGAVFVLLHHIDLPLGDIWQHLQEPLADGTTKTTLAQAGLERGKPWLGFDASQNYTLLTAIFGFSLINMAAYGTDHDLAQRMLTCKSPLKGSRSAWTAILMSLPITMIFMTIGALLFVFYKTGASARGAAPAAEFAGGRQVFPAFILGEMPAGLKGLMLAGLFAAGLGSLNSAINAMAATFVSDFYIPLTARRAGVCGKCGFNRVGLAPDSVCPECGAASIARTSDRHYLMVSRLATVGWGVGVGGFAVLCIYWRRANPQTTLIDFALQVMTFAYAGLLAVFLTAIFTRRGSTRSSLAALLVGFGAIAAMQSWSTVIGWISPLVSAEGESLVALKLAYPWQMLIATCLAFGVCCLGKPTGRQMHTGKES
jgi:SSS family transporter